MDPETSTTKIKSTQLGDGFAIWIPNGRTFDPHTGRGWEAEGITPGIEVSS